MWNVYYDVTILYFIAHKMHVSKTTKSTHLGLWALYLIYNLLINATFTQNFWPVSHSRGWICMMSGKLIKVILLDLLVQHFCPRKLLYHGYSLQSVMWSELLALSSHSFCESTYNINRRQKTLVSSNKFNVFQMLPRGP